MRSSRSKGVHREHSGEDQRPGPVRLAAIVSEDRPDLPDGEGLPPSLLAEMKGQIRCDGICFMGFDSGRHKTWVLQAGHPRL